MPCGSRRLEHEIGLEALVPGTLHDRAQEHGLEGAVVISEMTVRLSEGRDDLRHLETKGPVGIGQRRTVAARVGLVSLGGMSPDLNADTGKRAPSPARRTVPDIQKPPLPMRCTMGAPGR